MTNETDRTQPDQQQESVHAGIAGESIQAGQVVQLDSTGYLRVSSGGNTVGIAISGGNAGDKILYVSRGSVNDFSAPSSPYYLKEE